MNLKFYSSKLYLISLFLICFNAYSTSGSILGEPSKSVILDKPLKEKTENGRKKNNPIVVFEGKKEIRFFNDNNYIDCIKYEIKTSKKNYDIGEKISISIILEYFGGLHQSFKDEECQNLSIKVVFPRGFIQEGGNYFEFIPLEFSANNPRIELDVVGSFYEYNENPKFYLLKGPKNSNSETIFIKKGDLSLNLSENNDQRISKPRSTEEKIDKSLIAEQNIKTTVCPTPTNGNLGSKFCSYTVSGAGCSSIGGEYKWYNSSNQLLHSGPNYTINNSGTYKVSCISNTCAESPKKSFSIIIIKPTATNPTTISNPICGSSNVVLSATPIGTGYSYVWTGPTQIQNPNSNNVTIKASSTAAIYSVDVSFGGVTCAVSTIVYGKNVPTATINATGPILKCQGQTLSLVGSGTGTGTLSYNWSGPNSTNVSSTTLTQSNLIEKNTGIYTFKVTSSNSCFATSTINVQVSNPTIILSPQTICSGKSANLSANGCLGIVKWFDSNLSNEVIYQGQTFPTPILNSSKIYYASCSIGECVSKKVGVQVTVNPSPAVPQISPSTTSVCEGSSFKLTGIGNGVSYLWSGPQITNSLFSTSTASKTLNVTNANSNKAGTYTFSVKGSNNCISSVSTQVNVNKNPTNISVQNNSPVCLGGTITLAATGADEYKWTGPNSFISTGNTISISNSSLSNAGIYTVTGKNTNCPISITATTAIAITVSAAPSISALSSTNICEGSSVILKAVGCVSIIRWSNGYEGEFLTVDQSGTYTAKCISNSGCESSSSNSVVINTLPRVFPPIISASGSTRICEGGSVTLSATNCLGQVTWNEGSVGNTLVVNAEGGYMATCTDSNGCRSLFSDSINVFIKPMLMSPNVTASGPLTFCEGGNVTFNASPCPSGAIKWSNGVVSNSILVSESGSYSATCSIDGCESLPSLIQTVIVKEKPILNVSNQSICSGTSTSIPINGDALTTFSWTVNSSLNGISGAFNGNGNIISQVLTNPNNTTPSTITYSITGIGSNGCSANANSIVTVNPIPKFMANNLTQCSGINSVISFYSESINNYSWTVGGITGNITGASNGSGNSIGGTLTNPSSSNQGTVTYNVTATNAFGCSSTLSVVKTVNPVPNISANNQSICSEQAPQIKISSNTDNTYSWSVGNIVGNIIGASSGSGAIMAQSLINPNPSTLGSVQYDIVGTNSFGCTSTTQSTVSVNPKLSIITQNGKICSGESFTSSLISNKPGTFYSWTVASNAGAILGTSSGNGGIFSTGNLVNQGNLSNSVTYLITGTDPSGCLAITTVKITVNPKPSKPEIVVNGLTNLCQGDFTILKASGCSSGTIFWSNGATQDEIIVNSSGNYSVKCVSNSGCSSEFSEPLTIIVNPRPNVPSLAALSNTNICVDDSVIFVASGCKSGEYRWNSNIGFEEDSIRYEYYWGVPGEYYMNVECLNSFGCYSNSIGDTVLVTVNQRPERPTVSTLGSTTICEGQTVSLDVNGCLGDSTIWSNGSVSRNIIVSDIGNYSVKCATFNGCSSVNSESITVSKKELPQAPLLGMYPWQSSNIFIADTISFPIESGCSSGTIKWYPEVKYSTYGEPRNSLFQFFEPGVYDIYATCVFDGCESLPSNSYQVTVAEIPNNIKIISNNGYVLKPGVVTTLSAEGCDNLIYWSNGETGQTITVSSPGVYSVQCYNLDNNYYQSNLYYIFQD
ncbi:Ig-like domain-containing protein [Lacihabitans soyangensis]|nr:PKD-like domain-containing protein [Lacihabitans soyangensis]